MAGPLVRVHRPELQGLRAVAVALVVVYHVWFGRVSGGVDVFFVISGFLLTGQLARAAGRGPLELGRRWSRTIVRLLPCAVVVLVATVAAGTLLLPEGRWPQTLREVVAAALFLENWRPGGGRGRLRGAQHHVQPGAALLVAVHPRAVLPGLAAAGGAGRHRCAWRRRPGARVPDRRDPRGVRRVADVLGGADRDEPAAGLLPLADPLVGVRPRRPAGADDRHRPAGPPDPRPPGLDRPRRAAGLRGPAPGGRGLPGGRRAVADRVRRPGAAGR